MLRCHRRTPEGTCLEMVHAPRCVWWRELICPGGWLMPFVLIMITALAGTAWRFLLP